MGRAAKRISDKRLLKLLRAFLTAGVMENGIVSPTSDSREALKCFNFNGLHFWLS